MEGKPHKNLSDTTKLESLSGTSVGGSEAGARAPLNIAEIAADGRTHVRQMPDSAGFGRRKVMRMATELS